MYLKLEDLQAEHLSPVWRKKILPLNDESVQLEKLMNLIKCKLLPVVYCFAFTADRDNI